MEYFFESEEECKKKTGHHWIGNTESVICANCGKKVNSAANANYATITNCQLHQCKFCGEVFKAECEPLAVCICEGKKRNKECPIHGE